MKVLTMMWYDETHVFSFPWEPSDLMYMFVLSVAVMAEKLANHFASYRAATDLFLQYVDSGLNEDAKFMLAVRPSTHSLSLLRHTLKHTHTQKHLCLFSSRCTLAYTHIHT